ncbi:pre-mRNA-splicing regulator WTAP-like [Ruditapes philippinarum]|uniref:pre-mRNA-splicing regulator WTAP-like n=1 Tax=Ruditapes philippinarum TaxID=129788 RepID=UPI00295B93AA|nr:pre-mRNA-splicing regulator WTAP-like [Ruditapes philippinarum]XP_060577984.1 pre-mRNA-splicing regulator WTAP-like [Ruditapes philippinarum]XP_060577986.1 pre-mRNA-splicing regulator WTAP-like [Ruditapes philippinarum]
MADRSPTPKKVHSDSEDLEGLSKAELIARLKEQEQFIKQLESKRIKLDKAEDDTEINDRLKQQQKDASRRENTLVHRLTTKEQELQDYVNQISELKHAQTQGTTQLKSMLLDPAVNIVFQRMAKEMEEAQEKLKQTQNELSAWKFTPDSQTGKRLMARCQMLLQENEELGKTIASGKTAKLEGEIALQKTLVTEMKNNQSELDEFLGDLEEDVEGMQTMIYVLQQQLRESKEQIAALEEENNRLRSGDMSVSKTLPKKPDKLEERPIKIENKNQNAYSSDTDYAGMATRFYQEKTDSDLEAEYSYEGMYENDDKYQEELERQQSVEAEQYDYEENGYKNYDDDYDSQDYKSSYMETETEQEAMETDDTHQEMSKERTRPLEVENKSNNEHSHSVPNETTQDVTNSSVHNTSHSRSPKSVDTARQHKDDKQILHQEKITVTEQDSRDVENGRKDTVRTESCGKGNKTDRERTPEKSRIPSPRPSKVSPNKKAATKSKTSGNEGNHKTDATNGSPPKDHSPNSKYTKQLTVDVKERTDVSQSRSPRDRSPGSTGSLKDREPVLQKFMNGVTSTVDDIEDL